MNLIVIGGHDPRSGEAYTYIETIGGGQDGRPYGPGMSAVHANMSNTLNTPIEAMEISYPLRVKRYELRDGSSGAGDHPGGLGIIRTISPIGHEARVSLQSYRRQPGPYGLHGGEAGQSGVNWRRDLDGQQRMVAAKGSFSLADGEAVTLETPGGGGWNHPAAPVPG